MCEDGSDGVVAVIPVTGDQEPAVGGWVELEKDLLLHGGWQGEEESRRMEDELVDLEGCFPVG